MVRIPKISNGTILRSLKSLGEIIPIVTAQSFSYDAHKHEPVLLEIS